MLLPIQTPAIRIFIPIFILLGVLFSSSSEAQQPVQIDFDTFRNSLNEAESNQERLRTYTNFAFREIRGLPDSLFSLANEIDTLQNVPEEEKLSYKYLVLSVAWRSLNSDSTIYYADKSATLSKNLGQHENYMRAQNSIGVQYSQRRESLKAENVFVNALLYHEENNVEEFPKHFIYGNLGNIYSSVGAYDLSIEMYEKMLIDENNESDRCNILATLSSNLARLGKHEAAVDQLTPCLEATFIAPHIASIVRSNLSRIHWETGNINNAIFLLEEAADISLNEGILNLNVAHQIRLGKLYLEAERIEDASRQAELLKDPMFSRTSPPNLIKKHLFFARWYNLTNEYDQALQSSNEALTLAERTNLKPLLENIFQIRSNTYKGLGEIELALLETEKQIVQNTLMDEFEDQRELANAKVRHQLHIYEANLLSSASILSATKNQLATFVSLSLLFLTASIMLYLKFKNRDNSAKIITKQLSESEKERKNLEELIRIQNEKFKQRNGPILVSLGSQQKISIDNITHIQSDGNYIKIFRVNKPGVPLIERLTLKKCMDELPGEIFKKIHRSTIVNLRFINRVEGESVTLKNGAKLRLSRTVKKEFFS